MNDALLFLAIWTPQADLKAQECSYQLFSCGSLLAQGRARSAIQAVREADRKTQSMSVARAGWQPVHQGTRSTGVGVLRECVPVRVPGYYRYELVDCGVV